jgi:calmodulin
MRLLLQVRLAFRTLDKNGNGKIDSAEFKHLMTNIGNPLTEEEVMVLINAADKNKDGYIDFEEFVKIMMD